jgi:ribosomal protein S18 acetylase RimI-like enzyme
MEELRQLTEKDIPQVIALSTKIFDPILQGLDKNEDKKIWWGNYEKNGLLLGEYREEKLVGFAFFYEKEPHIKSMQCWMVGVDEKFRGRGILKSLMEAGEQELKKKGYEYINLNTFPEKLPAMYAYLQKYHFIQYHEEQKDWHGKLMRKVSFRKKL